MFCCIKRKVSPAENIEKDTIVYHGTLNDFKPDDILPLVGFFRRRSIS